MAKRLCSITVFGHTHVGKSTLVGYLWAETSRDFDPRLFADNERDMGSKYKADRKYAYLVDTHADERLRPVGMKAHGTSLAMHASSLTIGGSTVNVFDTPGSETQRKEAHKGLYYGDIGVFVIDVADLLNWPEHQHARLFAHLFTWQKFDKSAKNLIMVVAKMDTEKYSQKSFDRACDLLSIASGIAKNQIVPTAIIVDTGKSENVLTKSEQMPWYEGKCLLDLLHERVQVEQEILEEFGVMPIEKVLTEKEEGIILRGKVMEGSLQKDKVVQITPVNVDDSIDPIYAKIQGIRYVSSKEEISVATAGAFVTVLIKDIRSKGRRLHKDFEAARTACLFANCEPRVGALIQIQIDLSEQVTFRRFENISIIWFGRTLSTSVISIARQDQNWVLILEADGQSVAMHLDKDNQPAIKSFVARSSRWEAFRCKLTALIAEVDVILPVQNVDAASQYFTQNGEKFVVEDHRLIFRRSRVRSFLQENLERASKARLWEPCAEIEVKVQPV